MAEALKVLKAVRPDLQLIEAAAGGAAIDECGHPLPKATLDLCLASDATLFGAVGGPKWDHLEQHLRPEVGALLTLRRELNLYAKLQPAKIFKSMLMTSPLRLAEPKIDLIVVREIMSGIYFGQPRERRYGGSMAVDTCSYHKHEVERIAKRAFEIARSRRHHLVSVDKANVLETSRLWREVVTEVGAGFPDVNLTHMHIDNASVQLIRDPGQFDVILTENLLGDILSDIAAVVTGSLAMLPSASVGDPKDGKLIGLYEPVHGSAPDIAGQGKANPIGAILSAAMMLLYSLNDIANAVRIERAVEVTLEAGIRTVDIFEKNCRLVKTSEMGDAVVAALA